MTEAYALHEGAFGRAVVLETRDDLVAHAHADTQFAFWLGGAPVEAHLGSEVVRYSEHVALGTNAWESHDARVLDPSQPSIFLVFYITKQWLDERRSSSGRSFVFASPPVPIDASLRMACWRVLDIIVSPHHEQRSRIDDEVEGLLTAAMNATLAASASRPPHAAPVLDHRLRKAIAYMREHVHEPVVAEEIAGKVGLSRAHLFTLFRDQLHTTPQVFWSAVRVEEAVHRLLHESEPLTHLALDLGFSSPGNFTRFFRDHVGVTPSRFRRAGSAPPPHLLTGVPDD